MAAAQPSYAGGLEGGRAQGRRATVDHNTGCAGSIGQGASGPPGQPGRLSGHRLRITPVSLDVAERRGRQTGCTAGEGDRAALSGVGRSGQPRRVNRISTRETAIGPAGQQGFGDLLELIIRIVPMAGGRRAGSASWASAPLALRRQGPVHQPHSPGGGGLNLAPSVTACPGNTIKVAARQTPEFTQARWGQGGGRR